MSKYGDDHLSRLRRDSANIYQDIRSHLMHAMPLPDYARSKNRPDSVDMSDFPPMRIIRNILQVICFLSFFCAPLIYMPLVTIQVIMTMLTDRESIDLRGFQLPKPPFTPPFSKAPLCSTNSYPIMGSKRFEAVGTEWGPKFYCDFTTYVPVSIAIFSVFVGWSTFTIWPEMLSLGKGSVLMLIYMSFSVASLGAAVTAARIQDDGYAVTCKQLALDTGADGVNTSCAELKHIKFSELEQSRSLIASDVDAYMRLAQFGAWCLVGLAGTKVIISIYTLILTWFHARVMAYMLEFDDESSYSDLSTNN
ncbi:hypothetical protein Btru_025603 [Bulinus truncatus]|nr:hypothetical protein Btru_025603 [Bulinus truncatus]